MSVSDPDLAADLAGDDVVVAGQDLDPNPGAGQRRDRNAGALLWRIEEGDIAEQDQVAFVPDVITRPGFGDLLISDGDHPKPIGVEARSLLLHLDDMARVEPSHVIVHRIVRADRKYLFDCSLADQKMRNKVRAKSTEPRCSRLGGQALVCRIQLFQEFFRFRGSGVEQPLCDMGVSVAMRRR